VNCSTIDDACCKKTLARDRSSSSSIPAAVISYSSAVQSPTNFPNIDHDCPVSQVTILQSISAQRLPSVNDVLEIETKFEKSEHMLQHHDPARSIFSPGIAFLHFHFTAWNKLYRSLLRIPSRFSLPSEYLLPSELFEIRVYKPPPPASPSLSLERFTASDSHCSPSPALHG
jgi:hypothetical protein